MTLAYNIEPTNLDLIFIRNDTINMFFTVLKWNAVTEVWEAYDMTGLRIDIYFRRKDGLLVKTLTTEGGTPDITIITNTYSIYAAGFDTLGFYDYDVQLTDAGDKYTIQRGTAEVKKDYTT